MPLARIPISPTASYPPRISSFIIHPRPSHPSIGSLQSAFNASVGVRVARVTWHRQGPRRRRGLGPRRLRPAWPESHQGTWSAA